MDHKTELLDRIRRGRTDLIFDLLRLPDWQAVLGEGPIKVMQWLVYYNDLTAMKAVYNAGGELGGIHVDEELGHAAFFGHWKVCDWLIQHGANVNAAHPETGETPLHNALAKAGRPYYLHTVRLLVERGADVNAKTTGGRETGAFMRDVRTKGETPLHRAAAYADAATIEYLISHGAAKDTRDDHGDSPLSWASYHLGPGHILAMLAFGEHRISENSRTRITSDHGQGWGNGMDWNLFGEYLPDVDHSKPRDD